MDTNYTEFLIDWMGKISELKYQIYLKHFVSGLGNQMHVSHVDLDDIRKRAVFF